MRVAGILLAAGSGRRFGGDKLLHPLEDGTPIGVCSALRLRRAVGNVLVVVSNASGALRERLEEEGMDVLENRFNQGMGSSIAAGVQATRDADAWVIALADMPWIQAVTYARVYERLAAGAALAAPEYAGKRGHPVGFHAVYRQALSSLRGDRGAKDILEECAGALTRIPVQDPGIHWDVDTPGDLRRSQSTGTLFR